MKLLFISVSHNLHFLVPRHPPIRPPPIGKRLLTSAYLTLAYQDFRLSMSLPVFVTFAYHVQWPIRHVPIRLFMSLTKVLYWQFRHPEGYRGGFLKDLHTFFEIVQFPFSACSSWKSKPPPRCSGQKRELNYTQYGL